MKHLSSTSWLLSVLILLSGCGGGERTSGPAPASSPLLPSDPPSHVLDIAGNWQFSTTSVAGMAPATISGGIAQSGSSVSGAAHLDGSKCFDRLTTIGLTGTLTGSNITLTSTTVDGQVTTLTGSVSDYLSTGLTATFAGTYTIDGGCANGDHGNVTGIKVPLSLTP